MIKYIKLSIFLLLSLSLSSQSIVGGGGICAVSGDPNSLATLGVIDSRYSCTSIKDTVTGNIYTYVVENALGSRWVLVNNNTQNTATFWKLNGNSGTTAGTNFFGTTDMNDLVLKTNNEERMSFLSNQIRSTLPIETKIADSKSAYGFGLYTYSSTIGNFLYSNSGGNFRVNHYGLTIAPLSGSGATYLSGYGELGFFTGGEHRVNITSSGDVGINTTTPQYKLEVNGNASATKLHYTQNTQYANPYGASGSVTDQSVLVRNKTDGFIGEVNLYSLVAWNGGNSSGNLTIGNKDNTPFDIRTNDISRLGISNSGVVSIYNLPSGTVNDSIVTVNTAGDLNKRTASDVTGWSVNGATVYNQSSNIGIGTVLPLYKLDIDARTSTTQPLRLKGLQQGNSTDSILSSANGVLKRYGLVSNLSAGENNSQVLNATIAAGANLSGGGTLFTVTVSGAQVGDFVDFTLVSDDNDLTDINIKAWVSATNTVSYQVENKRATSIVFTNKPIRCRVRR